VQLSSKHVYKSSVSWPVKRNPVKMRFTVLKPLTFLPGASIHEQDPSNLESDPRPSPIEPVLAHFRLSSLPSSCPCGAACCSMLQHVAACCIPHIAASRVISVCCNMLLVARRKRLGSSTSLGVGTHHGHKNAMIATLHTHFYALVDSICSRLGLHRCNYL